MPTYTWECTHGHRFDNIQKMSAPPPACAECGRPTQKVITPVRFRISAGHNWYRRDENGSEPFDGVGRF